MEPVEHNTTLAELIDYIKQGVKDKVKSVLEKQPNFKKNLIKLCITAVETGSECIIGLLLEQGLNKNAALDIAVNNGNEKLINMLIDRGADVDEGLCFAVKTNKVNIIILFLKRGADINTDRKNGNTPLHIAIIQKCDSVIVEFLIRQGADVNARNKNNKSASDLVQNLLAGRNDLATREKFKTIEDLLKQNIQSDNMFNCLQGLPDGLSGYSYQIKLFTLYAVINTKLAISKECQYELGTEVKDLIPFDDIYLRKTQDGQTHCQFVQVKQTKKPEYNKIEQSNFFTMLKSGKYMKEYIKGNDTIVKMFKKFNEITDSHLGDGIFGEFIYCTNTNFHIASSPCFTSVNTVRDDLLCGVGRQKWKIQDRRYLDIEIKFVLLNLIGASNYFNVFDDEIKSKLKAQIKTLDSFMIQENMNKSLSKEILWSVQRIANEGSKAIGKYFEILENAKTKTKNAKGVEQVKLSFPDECELPHYAGDLSVFIDSAIVKINEAVKSVKSDKELFVHFSKWDDVTVVNKIEKFIQHFSIYTDCPNSDELDEIITKEISKEYKSHNPKLISDHCIQYFSKWVSSFKNERGNLFTDDSGKKLFRELSVQIFKSITKPYIEDLQTHGIHFKHDNKQLLDFINNVNNIKIFHVITDNTRLHAIHILQTLKKFENKLTNLIYPDNVLFTTSKFINKSSDMVQNFLNAFSSTANNDFLVIEFPKDCENSYELLYKLQNILTKNVRKKVIIISKKDNKLACGLKYMYNEHESCENAIGFKDLKKESQEAILEKSVPFQNHPKSLRTDLKIKHFLTIASACEVIDEEILSIIITKKEHLKISNFEAFNSNEYNSEYYIPRRVHLQIVKKVYLASFIDNLLFITGTFKHFLTRANVPVDFIHFYVEGMNFEECLGCIIPKPNTNMSNEEIFTRISNACDKNINWLEIREKHVFWKGIRINSWDVERVNVKVYETNETIVHSCSLPPEDIKQKVVILANHPGEGKTTMLTNLAHVMKEKIPDLWIIRVDLKDHVDNQASTSLSNINFSEDDTSKAIETVARMVVKDDHKNVNIKLERKLLEGTLKGHVKIKVVLLFDGFDEISPDYKENTCILLKALKKSSLNQMWITTRVHMKRYLEEQLETPAYILAPLTQDQKETFLSRFWKWNLKYNIDSEEENGGVEQICANIVNNLEICCDNYYKHTQTMIGLESFVDIIDNDTSYKSLSALQRAIDDILDLSICAEILLSEWNDSVVDGDEFANVPLNLKMLAENIFKMKWKISNLKKLGTFEIYKQFIEHKIKIYNKNKSRTQSGNPADKELADLANPIIKKMHRELAVKTLFPQSRFLPELNICNEYKDIYETLARVGLVKSSVNRFEFVHRSYAEYFLSEYLSIHFENPIVQTEILMDVLVYDGYQLVRTFLNMFLSQDEPKSCSPKVLKEMMKRQNSRGESVLHVASVGEDDNIRAFIMDNTERHSVALNLILKCGKYGLTRYQVNQWNANKDVCELIKEAVKKYPNILKDMTYERDNGQITLNKPAWVGNREASEIIIKIALEHNDALTDMLMKCDKRGQSALHVATYNNKIEMCEMILRTAYEQPDIFKLLMIICDKKGRTVLHTAALYDKVEVIDIILKATRKNPDILKYLMLICDAEGHTALHLTTLYDNKEICGVILRAVNEQPDVFREVVMKCDRNGRTVLCIAASQDRRQICDLLLEYAKDDPDVIRELVQKCDTQGNSPMHVATQNGHIEVVSTILNALSRIDMGFLKHLVTTDDQEGRSILQLAAQNGMQFIFNKVLRGPIQRSRAFDNFGRISRETGLDTAAQAVVGTMMNMSRDIVNSVNLNLNSVQGRSADNGEARGYTHRESRQTGQVGLGDVTRATLHVAHNIISNTMNLFFRND